MPVQTPNWQDCGSSRPKSPSFRAASDNSASGSAGAGSGQGAAGAEACGVDGWAWEHEAGWAWQHGELDWDFLRRRLRGLDSMGCGACGIWSEVLPSCAGGTWI